MTLAAGAGLELTSEYTITPKQREDFARDGHILLKGLLSDQEVAHWRTILADTVGQYIHETKLNEERGGYTTAFVQIMNLWKKNEATRPFIHSPRLAKAAADLMGVDGVRLYHDQALFKEPGGSSTPWHQDQYYWPLTTPNTITMWMPLVDVSIQMGALAFASGTHSGGSLGDIKISDTSEQVFQSIVDEKGYPLATSEMAAGDATFHLGWTLHRAPANNTDRMREVITIIYYEDGAVIAQPKNQSQEWDMGDWFPGQKPGEPAASPLNPLLFKRA